MSTMTRTLMIAAAVATALGMQPALAQGTGMQGTGPMTFAGFDLDGNGSISEAEFNQVRADRMAARGAPMGGGANAPSFADFDLNGDGQITAEEFSSVQQSRMEGRPGMGRGQGYGGGMGMRGNMPTFADFDEDGDGRISKTELERGRAARIAERSQQGHQMRNLQNAPSFEEMDLNGDQFIDRQEFAAAQRQHHQQRFQGQQPAVQSPQSSQPVIE